MKHTLKVTITLILFFFMAQFTGLLVINQYIDHKRSVETQIVSYKPLPYGFERPQVENQSTSFIYVLVAVLIGTSAILLLIKFRKISLFIWKVLFFISVSTALSIAFAAFLNVYVAGILAVGISFLRLYRPNIIIHNFSEIFIYGGLAAILVNIFNLFGAFMLLIAISAYDYVAVFRTKHMIKLAEFQSQSRVFAGLFIPYEMPKSIGKKSSKGEPKKSVAVLGGGDIGFTLIFAGVVMKYLMLQNSVLTGFLKTLIIPVFVSIALLILLVKGQQSKFYPAMPVLSLGCFIGYLIIFLS